MTALDWRPREWADHVERMRRFYASRPPATPPPMTHAEAERIERGEELHDAAACEPRDTDTIDTPAARRAAWRIHFHLDQEQP